MIVTNIISYIPFFFASLSLTRMRWYFFIKNACMLWVILSIGWLNDIPFCWMMLTIIRYFFLQRCFLSDDEGTRAFWKHWLTLKLLHSLPTTNPLQLQGIIIITINQYTAIIFITIKKTRNVFIMKSADLGLIFFGPSLNSACC